MIHGAVVHASHRIGRRSRPTRHVMARVRVDWLSGRRLLRHDVPRVRIDPIRRGRGRRRRHVVPGMGIDGRWSRCRRWRWRRHWMPLMLR